MRAESVAPQRRSRQEIDSSATAPIQPSRPLIGFLVHVQRRLHFIIIQYFPLARRVACHAAALAHRHLILPRNPLHAIPHDTQLSFRPARPKQTPGTVLWVPSSLAHGAGVPDDGAPARRVGAALLPNGGRPPDERPGDGDELPTHAIRAPTAANPTRLSQPGSRHAPLTAAVHADAGDPAVGALHPGRDHADQLGGQSDQEEVPVPARGPIRVP